MVKAELQEVNSISHFDYNDNNGICNVNCDAVFKGFIVSLHCLVMGA